MIKNTIYTKNLFLKKLIGFHLAIFLIVSSFLFTTYPDKKSVSGAPPFGIAEEEVPKVNPYSFLATWQRPNSPPKVGLQVGHWKNSEIPEELERLKKNTGARGGGKWEWEVNWQIADETRKLLKPHGIIVDVLPTTVPASYWADVFLAIHADGSEDKNKSGYKFAGPWRDMTGESENLVAILEKSYERHTKLENDPNITRNMRGYYAFSWWRYENAIHPMTTAVIAETGFLTNYSDQKLLIEAPEIPAQAIAEAIVKFLKQKALI